MDASDGFEVFERTAALELGAHGMVGDGPGETTADEGGSTGAYVFTTCPHDADADAGRGGSPGVVDGDTRLHGAHDAGTPGGSTVMEHTPLEAVPTKKRRAQKHNRTTQDRRKRQRWAAGLPATHDGGLGPRQGPGVGHYVGM